MCEDRCFVINVSVITRYNNARKQQMYHYIDIYNFIYKIPHIKLTYATCLILTFTVTFSKVELPGISVTP